MNRSDAPVKQAVPFGVNGQREALLSTTPAGDNTASYDAGFPPVTMILKAAGGLPPKGQDMNQILYELSALARWFSAGVINSYDAAFSTAIGGYPKGSLVVGTDGTTQYLSTTDSNLTNPNTGGAGWFNVSDGYLKSANNLSELTNASTARTNLALGNSATRNVGGVAGTVAAGDDSRIVGSLQASNNLSDLASPTTARTNLALGNSATLNVGTAASTVAAGNDSRITGAMQKANNLSDLINLVTARSNLGLGSAATQSVGTGTNQIPDMNSFTSSPATNGWFKFPNGLIIQYGIGGPLTNAAPDAVIGFNITFPNKCLFVTEHDLNNAARMSMIQIGYVTNTGFTGYTLGVLDRTIPSGLQPTITTTVQWLAIGY